MPWKWVLVWAPTEDEPEVPDNLPEEPPPSAPEQGA